MDVQRQTLQNRTFPEERKTRHKLMRTRECFQDRRLQLSGHSERVEENTWSGKRRTFKVIGSFSREKPQKT